MKLTKGEEYEVDVSCSEDWGDCGLYDMDNRFSDWHILNPGNPYREQRTITLEPKGNYNSEKFLSDLKSVVSSVPECTISPDSLSIDEIRDVGIPGGRKWLHLLGVGVVTAISVGGLVSWLED